MHALVRDALDQGARALTGGFRPDRPGYYYPATLLADVPAGARVLHEEPFGPVAPVVEFSRDDEGMLEFARLKVTHRTASSIKAAPNSQSTQTARS